MTPDPFTRSEVVGKALRHPRKRLRRSTSLASGYRS
jgi:hypothetical protein